MRHTATPIRHTATRRTAKAIQPVALSCTPAVRARRWWLPAALAVCAGVLLPVARAQRPIDLGFTYTQERSKFVGTSDTDFFRLRGATIDVGVGVAHKLGIAFAANGLAATNLRQSIDIHQASFLAGPRFTYNYGHITPSAWGRTVGTFIDAKVGYTFATSGLFPISGNALTNHAAALTYTGGGGVNFNVYHRMDLRIQADYVQTHLPNGGTNQQNNLRFSGGLNFHFGN
jgi:hypothetical protein